jgi:hypothetical protein
MEDLSPVIDKLKERTEKLIHLHSLAVEEITRLKVRNSELENMVETLETEARQLKERSVVSEGSKDALKEQIDVLVRDIDNCLEKLNA